MAVSDQAVVTGKQLDQLMYQHHPHSFDGCGAEGELGPSGNADGAWRRSRTACGSSSCATIRRSALAESRPLRPLQRPCLHAALFAAASGGSARSQCRGRSSFDTGGCRSTTSKPFRQIDSKTPGHPEYGVTTGVETTTGPLGQGVANSVGMAIAERWLAAHFNRPGFELFNYNIWAFCGDGDMMEGISSEAASIAGHLTLSNLCWIYDNNHITIEGKTDLAFDEDVGARFAGLWLGCAITFRRQRSGRAGRRVSSRRWALLTVPSSSSSTATSALVRRIGKTRKEAHGEALGEEEVKLTKRVYGWPEDAQVPGARRSAREFPRWDGQARAAIERPVERAVQASTARNIPIWPTSSTRMHTARTARRMGQGTPNISRPMPKAWQPAIRRPKF